MLWVVGEKRVVWGGVGGGGCGVGKGVGEGWGCGVGGDRGLETYFES